MEAFQQYLKQFPHFTEEIYEKLLPHLSIVELKANAYFLKEGQICNRIAFIEKGLVRIYYLNDGKEITNCFCRENNITCSYSSMISQTPSENSIQALEDTKLITLSYYDLQKFYEESLFWQQIGRIAGEREFVIEENYNRTMRTFSAIERYKYILQNESELLQRVPLNYLASYIQVTPETLSRIRKKVSSN